MYFIVHFFMILGGPGASRRFLDHTTAVGLGINSDVQTEVNYVAEKVSHLATSMMSMGSVVIDDDGVFEVLDNN